VDKGNNEKVIEKDIVATICKIQREVQGCSFLVTMLLITILSTECQTLKIISIVYLMQVTRGRTSGSKWIEEVVVQSWPP
jgi:hypothetical protein